MRLPTWLRRRKNSLTLGEQGEATAAHYLRRQGLRIIGRSVRTKFSEIDLVAVDRGTIVFVEVKSRRGGEHSTAAEAVDDEKQRRLTRAALAYLKAHRLLNYPTRCDVVAVHWPDDTADPRIDHFRNAFTTEGDRPFFA